MAYQALYRRYRPSRFEDFVGQEAVIRTLRGQVISRRIAHAYLFCGTRGTGKTSAAKVFARAINCETPENGEPCGHCPTCEALARENAMDILEIDAASNNGVDEVRDLRENIKYPPSVGQYRVYIIDEVHMLSTAAFNALLKTLEEPPAHAKFILATTEPQKLPATILSRCQRFDFGRIPANLIEERLAQAIEKEGMPYEAAALSRVARAAEGGMRDAWSILDMCLGYAQENGNGLSDELVREVLGSTDRATLFAFADCLIAGDAAGAMKTIDQVMRAGKEVQVFARDVSAHLRSLLFAGICDEAQCQQVLDVTAEDAREFMAQAARASRETLMRDMELFLGAESEMHWSSQPRYVLETVALRCCAPEAALQLESIAERLSLLEKGRGSAALPDLSDLRKRMDALEEQLAGGAPVSAKPKRAKAETPREEPKEAPVPEAPPEVKTVFSRLLDILRKTEPSLFGIVRGGKVIERENDVYTVLFPKTGAVYAGLLARDEYKEKVDAALSQAAGRPSKFNAVLEGKVKDNTLEARQEEQAREMQKEENLNKMIDMFGRENIVMDADI